MVYFLVFQHSFYTREQLRNVNSLDAYNMQQDGWVREVFHKEISGNHLIISKVLFYSSFISSLSFMHWSFVTTALSIARMHNHWKSKGSSLIPIPFLDPPMACAVPRKKVCKGVVKAEWVQLQAKLYHFKKDTLEMQGGKICHRGFYPVLNKHSSAQKIEMSDL